MELTEMTLPDESGISRRRVLRKAAYTAPVVFAIAAAPEVALGRSGGGKGGGGGGKGGGGGGGGKGGGGGGGKP